MRTIEVIPNPYIALDADGVPQGVVGAGAPGQFIGAQIDPLASQKTGKVRVFYPGSSVRDAKGVKGKPTFTRKVWLTSDIVTSIHAGELIVCTKADAMACGLSEKEFLEPEKALDAEKAKALAYYQSVKGPKAELKDIPREAMAPVAGDEGFVETAAIELSPTLKMIPTPKTEA